MAEELSPQRVSELAESGEAQIVDVRTEAEHDAGHIAGDVHLPLETLTDAAAELEQGRPVVFYCRSGDRSAMAAEAFRASGWDATSMQGGLAAWAEGGLPLEPAEGDVISPTGLPPR